MMKLGNRYEFHTHTLLSDGELLISEHVRRAENLGYEVISITDHADVTNIDEILSKIGEFIKSEGQYYKIKVLPGVELTHVPPQMINELAEYSKAKGAKIVVVHGETIVEPVALKTNLYAVKSKYVDILAHPGLITEEEVKLAVENNVYLELSARKGHSLTNGHVAKLASKFGANMLVDTDAHSPDDFISQEFAYKVALASGLNSEQAYKVVSLNPLNFIKKILDL
ncbi:histidinol phosphate phosphatase domain-containing protein [Haliovirga abyssi]|uniref:PHP domain-containing protein n=1 Tax=Haliovirga abyssi TaxID=2996794 RepID=A0AAU9DV57_9FUSO|nr:histidinol phosphate phosphatase domain-containing protein [Haliovirga abyssi]BDU49996.1 PHP domain-containing protein [Haliovirga abyssi]